MSIKHDIGIETLVILGILFCFYVAGDLTTTVWLIDKHPEGIIGESNPVGILIYTQKGVLGLILAKLVIFIAFSVLAIIIEFHYKHDRRSMLISNLSTLGLMAWSIIVVSVNVLLIYTLSLQAGSYESVFLPRIYMVFFTITLTGLIILPKFVPTYLGKIEILLAAVVILGPLALSPGLYQFLLNDNVTNFVIYLGLNVGVIILMIYGMNRLYKHIIPIKEKK